jgi:hypothetical protein
LASEVHNLLDRDVAPSPQSTKVKRWTTALSFSGMKESLVDEWESFCFDGVVIGPSISVSSIAGGHPGWVAERSAKERPAHRQR